jgi:hypothetical protein
MSDKNLFFRRLLFLYRIYKNEQFAQEKEERKRIVLAKEWSSEFD